MTHIKAAEVDPTEEAVPAVADMEAAVVVATGVNQATAEHPATAAGTVDSNWSQSMSITDV